MMNYIKNRLYEFEKLGEKGETIFNFKPFLELNLKSNIKTELLFCISTANSSAIAGLKFQKMLENVNVDRLEVKDLENLMSSAGVRFSSKKAIYAKEAIENFDLVVKALNMDDISARKYLVKKLRGLGYKEASHFLRNVGRKNLAIIDRHVLKWMIERGYIKELKTITPKKYELLERKLREIALDKTLAELDLIIWYKVTGKVLK